MSVTAYQNDIVRLTKEIADCDRDAGKENEKIARLTKEISSVQRSITTSTSPSLVQSKISQITSKQKEIAAAQKKLGEVNTRKANKHSDLGRKQQSLKSAMEQEARTHEQQERRRRDTELRHTREVTQEMQRQRRIQYEIAATPQFIDLTRLPEKIKVLFLAASPEDQEKLRLDVEVRGIEEKIRASEHRNSVTLISRWAVRTTDRLQHLNEHSPHIIHFSGHGSPDGDIIFEGPDGSSRFITKDAIVQLMNATAENIRLVVFNSCFSSGQAQAVTQYVDAAIGMNTSIGDEAAQVFAAQFYSAIGFGKSIRKAFEQAKVALMLEGIQEENTPELFVRDEVDAENIYLVRPETETSVAFVHSPTAILPDLKEKDILVLKAACESEAKRPGAFVMASKLIEALEPDGLTEQDIEESISILDDRGYLEEKQRMRDYAFVTNLGFDKYATAFLPDYREINRGIADAIVNHNARCVEEMKAFAPDVDDEVIERVLDIFEERDFVKLRKTLGSFNQVLICNHSLKRWLEAQV